MVVCLAHSKQVRIGCVELMSSSSSFHSILYSVLNQSIFIHFPLLLMKHETGYCIMKRG
jgi:hypothetical protein